jgi:hypothetical protein
VAAISWLRLRFAAPPSAAGGGPAFRGELASSSAPIARSRPSVPRSVRGAGQARSLSGRPRDRAARLPRLALRLGVRRSCARGAARLVRRARGLVVSARSWTSTSAARWRAVGACSWKRRLRQSSQYRRRRSGSGVLQSRQVAGSWANSERERRCRWSGIRAASAPR